MSISDTNHSLLYKNAVIGIAIIIVAYVIGKFTTAFSGKQLLFLIIGVVTAGICFYSIRSGLYLLMLIIVAFPTDYLYRVAGIEVAGKNFKLPEIIYGLVLLSWAFRILTKRTHLPEFRKNMPMYFLFLTILISAIADILRYGQIQNTIMGLKPLSYYGIYFVAVSTITNSKEVKKIHNVIIIGALLYSLLIISMYLWKSHPLIQYTHMGYEGYQATGRAGFPNVMNVIIALALLFTRWFISPSGRERKLCILTSFLFLYILIVSQWRAGWISMIMYTFLLLGVLVHKREIRSSRVFTGIAVSAFTILIMGIVLYASGGSNQLTRLTNRVKTFQNIKTDSSLVYRAEKVKDSMPGIMEHLIVGAGFSTYYYDPKTDEYYPGSTFDESHTQILRMMGLTGYAIFIWIFIWFFRKTLYIYRYSKGGFNSQVQLSQILFCYPVNFFRS